MEPVAGRALWRSIRILERYLTSIKSGAVAFARSSGSLRYWERNADATRFSGSIEQGGWKKLR